MNVWTGVGLACLVVGFPLLLLSLLWLLGRLESWMLEADERAAAVAEVLEQAERAEEVEAAVSRLLADVTDTPRPRVRVTPRRRVVRTGLLRRLRPAAHRARRVQ